MRSSIRVAHGGLLIVSLFSLLGCGGDAPDGRGGVVARAGGQEFPVDRLAEIAARGSYVPLERDVLERLAGLWVDYSLFAQRLAQGDSLLDSATVLNAMWDDAQLQIIKHYHREIVGQRVVVDDAAVDSAYQAGDHRLIYHILVSAPAGMTQAEKVARRRRAEQLRAVAASGATGWIEANRENEDSVSRVEGGSFGLIGPGETVPEFDKVAFSLSPGEVSAVTESAIGYHIIKRPLLGEVREEFTTAIQDLMIQRMNVAFAGELEERWEIVVNGDALEKTREVAEDPTHARRLGQVLGTYKGGRFTAADLVRWLRALTPDYAATVRQADDEQLKQFLRSLMRNEVLEREAREAGYGLTEPDLAELQEAMAWELGQLRSAMALDSALAGAQDPTERVRVAAAAVDRYMAEVTSDLALLVLVPPFLAERLRAEMEWEVSLEGVDRALAHGARLRVLLENSERVGNHSQAVDSAPAKEHENE